MLRPAPTAALALFGMGLAVGCAARGGAEARFAGSGAAGYVTTARGPAVSGELGADALHTIVQAAARAAGSELVGDARLSALAEEGASDAWHAEQLGLTELAPELHRFSATSLETLAVVLRDQLPVLLAGAGFTHYGAHLRLASTGPTLSVVLSRRPFRLEPVPRQVEVGARLRLQGVLLGYRDAELVQITPGGERTRFTAGTGERFDVRLVLDGEGAHDVELTGRGAQDRQLLARLRVYAGVAPAPRRLSREAPGLDPAKLLHDVLARVNQERAARGLGALQAHGVLDALCARHAASWIDARRQGRPLQQVPSAAARARETGVAGGFAQDFVVQVGATSDVATALLADAPARASLLSADATHLGLGVGRDGDGGQWAAAGLVVQLAAPIDPARASQRLLALLNAARRARGAAALVPDAQLTTVAAEHAAAFFEATLPSQEQAVAAATAGLGSVALRYRRTEAVMVVAATVDAAATLEPALAADVQAVGIGIAQGDRPDTGPRRIAVILVLGSQR